MIAGFLGSRYALKRSVDDVHGSARLSDRYDRELLRQIASLL
jgi:hypothetical protein